jgi:hypothetical protein
MSKYSDADFQKDLAELTGLINNYSTPNETKSANTMAEVSGGKRRSKRSSKSPKRSSKKRSMKRSSKKRSHKKRSSHKTRSLKRHSGGAKRHHKKDVDGHLLRSFRVIEINGKNVSNSADWSSRFYHGKAKKNTPLQGAKNAYRWIRQHMGKGGKYLFKLIETTKGGDDYGKVFGPYAAKPVKLAKPIVFKLKDKRTGQKKEIVSDYLYEVKVAKKSDK